MSVSQIRAELQDRWHDDPAIELCLRIVGFVERLPSEQARMLTFRTLSQGVGIKSIDDSFMRALTILVSSRVAALDAHALLVDEDESEHEIAPEELAQARATGNLIHPETGVVVHDYESRVIPFFVPSAKFLAADDD